MVNKYEIVWLVLLTYYIVTAGGPAMMADEEQRIF